MVDLVDVQIELEISQGRIKEAADLLRQRGGESGQLFEMLGDLIDPDKLQRMGRPVEKNTSEYRSKQNAMMFEYYLLLAYYKAEKGWKNPAEVAKGCVLDAHECGKTFFETSHKFCGKRQKRLVDIYLELMGEQGIDFPEWVKNY